MESGSRPDRRSGGGLAEVEGAVIVVASQAGRAPLPDGSLGRCVLAEPGKPWWPVATLLGRRGF
jgi:hypothetical protein